MKVAYICEPQIGGTYTSFRQVRERLLSRGIDYRCVPPSDRAEYATTPFAADEGVDFLDYPEADPSSMARRLIEHLRDAGYAAAVLLPGCYPFVSGLPPYLPRSVRCVARMPHNARGVYAPAALMARHFNRIVAVGPRLKSDLVGSYGVPESKVEVISNGVDLSRFAPGREAAARRAIFVGRIEDVQKNVFLLPRILRRALEHDSGAFLTVVGSGPDSERLRQRLMEAGLEGNFEMTGRVDPAGIPEMLRTHGVFVLPSRFEGCSNSTLEAMASGCVPLLSRLPGISDHVVVQGKSGFLFVPGDWKGIGDAWGRLMRTEEKCRRMAAAARQEVEARFSLETMADAYARLFRSVAEEPDDRPDPLPPEAYVLHSGLGPTWRRWIPESAKKMLRTWAARMGFSP